MTPDSLLIVGRGPSVYKHDWASTNLPVMAVSSGVFALPETVMPEHFVSLDGVKFFLDTLSTDNPCEIPPHSWEIDGTARIWPFWREPGIRKHVVRERNRHGFYRNWPGGDLLEAIPEDHRPQFMRMMTGKIHEFGFQPGWADFPNVEGWPIIAESGPDFGDGVMGLEGLNNSLLMALQLAPRLGYKTISMVGVDLNYDFYEPLVEKLKDWEPIARDAGCTWTNLSPESSLSEWMQTVEWSCA